MKSIGPNKTFNQTNIKVEGHVPFRNDLKLYGKKVEFVFKKRIRGMRKFSSAKQLIDQISKDIAFV
jgi:FAD synthase